MSPRPLLVAALRAAATPHRSRGRWSRRLRAVAIRALVPRLLARGRLSDALDALAAGPAPSGPGDAGRVVDDLSRLPVSCLHRAVTAWAISRSRGEDVRLVFGVPADAATRLVAHAWVERGGVPIGEPPDVRRRYTVTFEHPPPPPRAARALEPAMDLVNASSDVILTELEDGTGVLLHLGTRFYYSLNRTGVAAWKLLSSAEPRSVEEVVAELSRSFACARPEDVRRDLDALLGELRDEGLLAG